MNLITARSGLRGRRTDGGQRTGSGQSRLGWLDGLRGIAALAVALQHFDITTLVSWGGDVRQNFDFGLYGVMAFFLVSGYIIPASLERRGDVRAFWVGRVFRIHPALIATIVVCLLVLPADKQAVAIFQSKHPSLDLLANSLMLQDLMGVTSGLRVMWTLTYEMIFYFVVSALFVLGWHRRSAGVAMLSAGVALLFGTAIATSTITVSLASTKHLVLAVAVIVVTALALILTGGKSAIRTGALMLAGVALTLVLLNGRAPAYETFMIFATMFAGTVIYRAEQGQIDRVLAWVCCGFVLLAGVLVGPLYNHDGYQNQTWTTGWVSWSSSYALAWGSFGLFMLLRKRRIPRVLTWLGAISFSVYLVHVPVLMAMGGPAERPTFTAPLSQKVLWTVGFFVFVLISSELLYRLVEMPMQKVGRRVVKALDRRTATPPAAPVLPAQPGPGEPELLPAGAGGPSAG
ncbi:acyltransferase [Streptomyces tateyamensis]|uniref:Acyltransferase n=1 Tax=Streptomyces tateyamensis TaxID=565073 RepID=A0A2V4N0D7_9ACTN|nr:acyltransferase [Streptomyces tateyamensis]PYC77198.1 acyltransferase [Streptomyces tateyamensis]